MTYSVRHPAKFSETILTEIEDVLTAWGLNVRTILDPFAGTGRVHRLWRPWCDTYGIELEHEWAELAQENTVVGNALHLPFADNTFDAIVTSPTYGNRMADHHEPKDKCKRCWGAGKVYPLHLSERKCPACLGNGLTRRNTYTHAIGRKLHPDNSGQLQWGDEYRDFHRAAWREASRVLRSSGLFVMNVSDHIRKGEQQCVVDWHRGALKQLGFGIIDEVHVKTPRQRQGANGHLRVGHEVILVGHRAS